MPIKNLILFFSFLAFISCNKPTVQSNQLVDSVSSVIPISVSIKIDTTEIKPVCSNSTALIDTARRYVGIKEKTGKNDGYFIEIFQKSVGIAPHAPYCAAFVSYDLTAAHTTYPKVRSGLARSFKLTNSIKAIDVYYGAAHVPKGSLMGFENIGTYSGHIEITVKDSKGSIIETIGANTSNGLQGSQSDGNGIYRRTRRLVPYGPSSKGLIPTWFTLVKY
jgi:hypothetical protein